MKKILLFASVLLLIVFLLISYLHYKSSLLYESGVYCKCVGVEFNDKCLGVRTTCLGKESPMSLPINKNHKKQIELLKIDFNGEVLETQDTFYFSPGDSCVGDIKAKLQYIYYNGISIDIIENQELNGDYYEVNPPIRVTMGDGDCIDARSLCMDVSYEYCFSVDKSVKPHKYSYEIKSKSTMPRPNW